MKQIKSIPWEEVKEQWKQSEDNELWRDFYQKKGFKTWEDWRWPRIKMLKLAERDWNLEESENTIEEVRAMFCDATTRWTDFYTRRSDSTFKNLKDHPFFVNHKRVQSIRENFPNKSQLIGLRHKDQIIVVDGHHRATAIAGMPDSNHIEIQMALSEISDNEFDKLYFGGKLLKLERNIWSTIALIRSQMKNTLD